MNRFPAAVAFQALVLARAAAPAAGKPDAMRMITRHPVPCTVNLHRGDRWPTGSARPCREELAPQAILLSEIARRIRYSLVDDIGKKVVPDVSRLQGCN